MKKMDISGLEIKGIRATPFYQITKFGKTEWYCVCHCGNIFLADGRRFKNGKVNSCGCSRSPLLADLTGKKYGSLTPLSFSHREKDRSIWQCRCDCGNITFARADQMISGRRKTCGCHINCKKSDTRFNHFWYFYNNKNEKMECRSSYEVILWNYLTKIMRLDVQYEKEKFVLDDGRVYVPDFYVESQDIYFETKGSEERMDKFEEFKTTHNIVLMKWKDIVDFCKLPLRSWGAYNYQAKKLGVSIEDFFANMVYLYYSPDLKVV